MGVLNSKIKENRNLTRFSKCVKIIFVGRWGARKFESANSLNKPTITHPFNRQLGHIK